MIESSPTSQDQPIETNILSKNKTEMQLDLSKAQQQQYQQMNFQNKCLKSSNSLSSSSLHQNRKYKQSGDYSKLSTKRQLEQIEYMVNLNEKYYTSDQTEKVQEDKNIQSNPNMPLIKQELMSPFKKNILPINVRNSQSLLYQRGKQKRIKSQKIELAFYNSPHHEKLHLGNTFFPPKPTVLSGYNSPLATARPASEDFDMTQSIMQNSQTSHLLQQSNSSLINQQRINSPTQTYQRCNSSQKTFQESTYTQKSNNINTQTMPANQPCMDIKYIEYLSTPIVFNADFKSNYNCPHRLIGKHKQKQEQIQLNDIFNKNNQCWPNFNYNNKQLREKTPALQIEAHLNYNTSQKAVIDKSMAPIVLKKGNIQSNLNMPKFATDLETLGNFTVAKKNLISYINNLKKL